MAFIFLLYTRLYRNKPIGMFRVNKMSKRFGLPLIARKPNG